MPTLTDEQRELASSESSVRAARGIASVAWKKCRGRTGVTYEDLLSAALLGLCEAAASFTPERGTPFLAFARARIRGAVSDWLREHGGFGMRVKRSELVSFRKPSAFPASGVSTTSVRSCPPRGRTSERVRRGPQPLDGFATLDAVVREHVRKVLVASGGNRAVVAVTLRVSPKTVYNWLRRWPELKEASS